MSIQSAFLLRPTRACFAAMAVLSWTVTALGQVPSAATGATPKELVPRPDAPSAAPAVGETIEGRVSSYLLSPEAEVNGVLLDNGRQVRVPPHLGAELAALIKPGDRIRWSGDGTPAAGLGAPPAPWTITALPSGRTLTDKPPTPGTERAAPAPVAQGQNALKPMKASGVIKRVLTGPRGETNGVILENGTQVGIAPQAPGETERLLTVGTHLNVEGYGRTSRYGTALQATVLARPGEAPITLFPPKPLP